MILADPPSFFDNHYLVTTIIVLASLFTISFIDNPIFAEKEASIVNATITILPADPVFKAGDTKKIILLIDNTANDNLITVKNSTVLYWPSTTFEKFEVPAKNSKTESIDVTIPADTSPGKYPLIITVSDSEDKMKTISSTLTVERFQPLELSWMLGLLGAYLIPAQIIERIIEPIKNRRERSVVFHKGIENLTEELTFWTTMRKNIIAAKTTELKTKFKKISDPAEKDAIDEGLIKRTKKFLHDDLKQLNRKIDEISKELSKAKTSKAWTLWQYGVALAIPAGILFSYYGLGILQINGFSGFEFRVFDAIINTLFIGSGTKPIHDIIGYITEGKKAQKKKVEI